LEGAQTTFWELGSLLEELLDEISQGFTTSISIESQMLTSATSPEDVGGLLEEHQLMREHEEYLGSLMSMERYDLEMQEDVHVSQGPLFTRGFETVGHTHTHGDSRARGSYEDISICVPGLADIHIEVDRTVHLGYVMMQEDMGACMTIVVAFIHTWVTWKKSSIHSVCPWGQVRVKVLSPNPQLLRLGQLLAKPRGVVPKENNLRLKTKSKQLVF
jgi:hypothetical protein